MDDDAVQRAYHRQMYIDLIRAYLLDYGSRHDLARALDVSEVAVHHWLKPLHFEGGARASNHWSVALTHDAGRLRDDLSWLQTPSPTRARKIATCLPSDAERRDALLHHIEMARGPGPLPKESDAPPGGVELHLAIGSIGRLHALALHSNNSTETRVAYAEIWRTCLELMPRVDGARSPLERAQLLMFLHDTASVLDRNDLALAYARETLLITNEASAIGNREAVQRMNVNALVAEAVSLNNLGLGKDAIEAAALAATLPACRAEPESWQRSTLEQRLKGLSRLARFSVAEAEHLADEAKDCAQYDEGLSIGIDSYLAATYLAHVHTRGSPKSARKAEQLVENLRPRVSTRHGLSPLRRVRFLRVAAAVYGVRKDREEQNEMLRQAVTLVWSAGLAHQRREIERLYGNVIRRLV